MRHLHIATLREAWLLGDTRSYDQDPRFGLCVLAEIASKALSAAVNDVGTAIGVLGRLTRALAHLEGDGDDAGEEQVAYPNIFIRPITAHELLLDAFRPIARDGAGAIELGLRLQAALAHVSRLRPPAGALEGDLGHAAAMVARDALIRARAAMATETDRAELDEAAGHLLRQHGLSPD